MERDFPDTETDYTKNLVVNGDFSTEGLAPWTSDPGDMKRVPGGVLLDNSRITQVINIPAGTRQIRLAFKASSVEASPILASPMARCQVTVGDVASFDIASDGAVDEVVALPPDFTGSLSLGFMALLGSFKLADVSLRALKTEEALQQDFVRNGGFEEGLPPWQGTDVDIADGRARFSGSFGRISQSLGKGRKGSGFVLEFNIVSMDNDGSCTVELEGVGKWSFAPSTDAEGAPGPANTLQVRGTFPADEAIELVLVVSGTRFELDDVSLMAIRP